MAGLVTEVAVGTTPKMGRRSMALADIDPKYVSQVNHCSNSLSGSRISNVKKEILIDDELI